MSETTAIEWTDATWSPWEGCTKVGHGCDHCYAEGMNRWLRKGENWGPGAPRREYSDAHWRKPLLWNAKAQAVGKRMRVFPSVCDPFDNEVDPAWRARFFALIADTPSLDWLLLTKRIGNAARMIEQAIVDYGGICNIDGACWPWPNVWLGATVVNQEEADRDIPKLLATPARVRFLSIEPMLGRMYIEDIPDPTGGVCLKPLAGLRWVGDGQGRSEVRSLGGRIDWVICGGESGPEARPMHPDWVCGLRQQCAAAGVPFLFKQWGEWAPRRAVAGGDEGGDLRRGHVRYLQGDGREPDGHFRKGDAAVARVGKKAAGRLLDGRTHDDFPKAAA